MIIDKFGQMIFSQKDLCDVYLTDPEKTLKQVFIEETINFMDTLENLPELIKYIPPNQTTEEFDEEHSSNWFFPEEYKQMDIAKWVLDQCKSDDELQRAGEELLLFQERDMFILLRYLKYLVDIMRKNNIVWGVGRGSSVASFVLYLIGIHKINSLYYQLSITEFLK